MVFIDLPDETLVYILSLSEPQAIVRGQQICRKLCSLIATSPLLTYILTLYSLGYDRPSVPRPDLTLSGCIELLREHRLHWTRPHTLRATRYDLDATRHSRSYYIGGVYAHGMVSNWLGDLHTLHFYQFESKNLGIGFKKWTLQNPGGMDVHIRNFTIDPEQDLLILVEPLRPISNPSVDSLKFGECVIHLRTMSTGEAHPQALEPIIIVTFPNPTRGPFSGFRVEVFGAMFTIRTSIIQNDSQIGILNWRRGTEVARIPSARGTYFTCVLVSESMILLPRSSTTHELPLAEPGILNTYGSLDLHTFDPLCDSPVPTRVVASFYLPTMDDNHEESTITVECNPGPGPSSTDGSSRPKVYELLARDRTISLSLQVRSKVSIRPHARLYIPVSSLLDPLATRQSQGQDSGYQMPFEPMRIPWNMWGHRTNWIHAGSISASWSNLSSCIFGRRLVVPWDFEQRSDERTDKVLLIDFEQRDLDWESHSDRLEIPVPTPGIDVGSAEPPVVRDGDIGRSIFCREGASAKMEWARTLMPIDELMHYYVDGVVMDDEHLLISLRLQGLESEGSEAGRTPLLVYTL